mgnify:CR=1 FL=1
MAEALQPQSSGDACDVLVLAGDRRPGDPLVTQFNVAGKALVPLAGLALLERVLDVINAWPQTRRVVLVAPSHPDYQAIVDRVGFRAGQLVWVEPEPSLYGSVKKALSVPDCWNDLGLLVSADHGLLQADWLTQVAEALDCDTDLVVAMANWSAVMSAYPDNRRTRYRFSDQSLCGGNLFAFRLPGLSRVLTRWHQVEQERKKPWRMLSILGVRPLMRYLAGRLSSNEAFDALSNIVDAKVRPKIVDDPAIAVDVDGLEDLALAESVLAERRQSLGPDRAC